MKATMVMIGGAVLLASCGGGTDEQRTAQNASAATACESKANNANYSGFSESDIQTLLKQRADTIKADAGTPEWDAQAAEFAKSFLGRIGMQPDSLCKSDYKDIQTLMGAEMDLESRSPQDNAGTLTGDALESYVRTLYRTAGLTAERGYRKLDEQVNYTLNAVKRTRDSWGK
ncbi:hypothetical protein [Stakelama pacifica]|uniref:Lipoprotein n=1 Tax=Stakelama pacifica TaxID=517720 RepID=A0A4R6FXJ5_9SPHN|nr:hypothetical protein [Stakelama pacifica]MAX00145.1 hypothetical protein [Sphingomonas sp.]MAX00527.1 hypothetical protein [Sphingomonas sp.]TDN86673.1 hypothetical protein EV664_101248 [Stakelama pacifica]GGO90343.1 hypothetical protein GCM10011329_02430 [Stakelama pacifica]